MYYFAIVIPLLLFLAWFIFGRKSRPRNAPLQALDKNLIPLLDAQVDYYRDLDVKGKKRFESNVALFCNMLTLKAWGWR